MRVQVELEVEALNRRLRLLDDELEQSQTRLQTTQDTLHETNKVADETDRSVASWDMSQDTLVAAAADDDDERNGARQIAPSWISLSPNSEK